VKLKFRQSAVVSPRKPDYDYIAKAEQELKLGDDGFNERYDEMLIGNYTHRKVVEKWAGARILHELGYLSEELTSSKYRRSTFQSYINYQKLYLDEVTRKAEHVELRKRMMSGRQWR